MMLAAYYLARCVRRDPGGRARPPEALGAPTWKAAYASVFEALGAGRTPGQFRPACRTRALPSEPCLKTAGSGATKGLGGSPPCSRIHQEWKDRQDTELEALVLSFPDRASPGLRHR